jgi:hypothetical protein
MARSLRAAVFASLLLLSSLTADPAAAEHQAQCTGDPSLDAARAACGMVVPAGASSFVWPRDATPPAEAFAPASVLASEVAGVPLSFSVWGQDRAGQWVGWSAEWPAAHSLLTRLERGRSYVVSSSVGFRWSFGGEARPLLERAQVISFYGHPGVPLMGALGRYATPEEALAAVAALAKQYDALNGPLQTIPALHLIAAVAQRSAGADGAYLGRMSAARVDEYVRATEAGGGLLFLDIQIGWADALAEVRRYEQALLHDHVHVALDPEFATRVKALPPGQAIGSIDAVTVNAVQAYLDGLVERHGLARKVLIVHQFRDDMLGRPERLQRYANVDLVIDMDGFGPRLTKLWGYDRFALAGHSAYPAFKLFFDWDVRLFSPEEIVAFERPPAIVIYQ